MNLGATASTKTKHCKRDERRPRTMKLCRVAKHLYEINILNCGVKNRIFQREPWDLT